MGHVTVTWQTTTVFPEMLFYVDADPLHVDRYVQGKKRVPSSSFGGKKGETKLNGVCCGELVRAFNIVMYILTLWEGYIVAISPIWEMQI